MRKLVVHHISIVIAFISLCCSYYKAVNIECDATRSVITS